MSLPTRNRADLAENAIRSVLGQSDCEVDILVSDNSVSAAQRSQLSEFCRQSGNPRLRYVIPLEPLPMSQHWDGVMERTLSLSGASHIAFLTDRMMFKPDALKTLLQIITVYPDKILTYMHDIVDDFSTPVLVRQYTWTGNLYPVPSTRLLELSAQSVMYDSGVPRMINCLVPRTVLEAIRLRFGNFFDSISPDWNFAYRALEIVESILFSDKAALVHYAQQRSTGQATHHGVANDAYTEFIRDLKGAPRNPGAPYPEILTVWNGIISEYCQVKEATQSSKFPKLDVENYERALAAGIEEIKDPERQEQMRARLLARGWRPPDAPSNTPPPMSSVSASPPDLRD